LKYISVFASLDGEYLINIGKKHGMTKSQIDLFRHFTEVQLFLTIDNTGLVIGVDAEDILFAPKEVKTTIKIPYGEWSLSSGRWFHNSLLSLSEEEQHDLNYRNGFSCHHGYSPNKCPLCEVK